ncbi:MAG TPA: DNA cytosine methyltransferase [Bryobacteraceae bacterium]|nr:DNA cytosine methyltransferase [Bryobacteraceae bacterium]
MKPRALDLFCGAGGATKGLQRAGFHVTGIDIKPQRRYCGDAFIQADALRPPLNLDEFDFIWASPPCQAHSDLKSAWNAKKHPDLIPPTRDLLETSGKLFAIENVVGAPLRSSIMLCGTQFDLGTDDAEIWRHRHIEANFLIPIRFCRHGQRARVIGVYGGHGRDRRRKTNTQDYSTEERRQAMDIDWMSGMELSQAIPPAYADYIGRAALNSILTCRQPLENSRRQRASIPQVLAHPFVRPQ